MGWVINTVVAGTLAVAASPAYVPSGFSGALFSRTLSNPALHLRHGYGGPPKPGAKAEAGFHEERQQRPTIVPQILTQVGDRAQLGVALRDVDENAAKERKLPTAEGAVVERVEPGSAAEKAGIKAGDVIVSFDGERVRSVRQLQRLVGDTPPERAVKITVMRDGRKTDVTATLTRATGSMSALAGDSQWLDELQNRLGDLPRAFRYDWRGDQAPGDIVPRAPGEPRAAPRTPFDRVPGEPRFPFNGWTSGAGRLGVVVQEMTPQLGDYFGSKEGVLVTSVTDESPAAHAGLRAGDVITAVNGKAVKDVNALLSVVRSQPDGQEMTIAIVRDKKPQTLKAKLLNATRARPI